MTSPIEDYALIGDCQTAALVSREGSIDWLCLPRFDSAACFAALLGTPDHGRWSIAPASPIRSVVRSYRGASLVLETVFTTDEGEVALIDCMPPRGEIADLVRIVECRRGQVPMRLEFAVRFDYGSFVPWVERCEAGITAIAGPDTLRLRSRVPLHGEQFKTLANFVVGAGDRLPFDLTWGPSHRPLPAPIDPEWSLRDTEHWWRDWACACTYRGPWRDDVVRSLVTLKGLTFAPTGGIVAAPTTSLPAQFGGVRNWDYRYCWLRDATFTLYALLGGGFLEEARAWRAWLLRAVAGKPSQLQIVYGIAGERRLPEMELPWLPGYGGAAPVRIGNSAAQQFQHDVVGEVMDTMHQCWRAGIVGSRDGWRLERALINHLEATWEKPDKGIWEVRGPDQHFTHSKVMAWVGVDRAIKAVEQFGFDGPVDRWRRLRAEIHEQVCRRAYDSDLGAFVQFYGSKRLDASLLVMPLVGFLPASDPRVRGTVAAIERHLTREGCFVYRYVTDRDVEGLPTGEAAFLLCSFWLVDNLVLMGRHDEAERIFERLLSVRNDVGLLSEGYDVDGRRLAGNYPQAFSHVGLVNSAVNLAPGRGPAEERPSR